jgi:CD109 antigen
VQFNRIPSGCGEQTIAAFVPIIVVLDYLTAINNLTAETESRAKSYLEIGYQTELTYQRFDGSFSCFGQSDDSGSTWLTAFVVKSFFEAKKYILIDDNVVNNALSWLINQQSLNGRFPEVGRVSHFGRFSLFTS